MMLKVVTVEKALEVIKNNFKDIKIEKENITLLKSRGRVLAGDVIAKEDVPSFNRSTVDGFAVNAKDTFGSSESIPAQLNIKGEILMGESTDEILHDGECIKISTGGMLPRGADAALMVEYTDTNFGDFCLAYKAVSPFENVTRKGDDVKKDDVVLEKGTVITTKEIGTLASMGYSEVEVFKKIKVGIISTGDELVPIEKNPEAGEVRDVNSYMLFSLLESFGCECTLYGIIKDGFHKIRETVLKANTENDIVLISGGSSAGKKDMTVDIINDLGETYVHGIAMKPGKPTIIGKIKNKPVFGLPGHPLACYFVTTLFIKPLIDLIYTIDRKENTIRGMITSNVSSNHGRHEVLPVKINDCNEVVPLFSKSGIISLLSKCDGYINIDRNCEGLKKGDEVTVYLLGE